jgi:hypothetical protein
VSSVKDSLDEFQFIAVNPVWPTLTAHHSIALLLHRETCSGKWKGCWSDPNSLDDAYFEAYQEDMAQSLCKQLCGESIEVTPQRLFNINRCTSEAISGEGLCSQALCLSLLAAVWLQERRQRERLLTNGSEVYEQVREACDYVREIADEWVRDVLDV